jgi:hypothetical protein
MQSASETVIYSNPGSRLRPLDRGGQRAHIAGGRPESIGDIGGERVNRRGDDERSRRVHDGSVMTSGAVSSTVVPQNSANVA